MKWPWSKSDRERKAIAALAIERRRADQLSVDLVESDVQKSACIAMMHEQVGMLRAWFKDLACEDTPINPSDLMLDYEAEVWKSYAPDYFPVGKPEGNTEGMPS